MLYSEILIASAVYFVLQIDYFIMLFLTQTLHENEQHEHSTECLFKDKNNTNLQNDKLKLHFRSYNCLFLHVTNRRRKKHVSTSSSFTLFHSSPVL